jgi:arsenate reductase-like glutaredoxin family protein
MLLYRINKAVVLKADYHTQVLTTEEIQQILKQLEIESDKEIRTKEGNIS